MFNHCVEPHFFQSQAEYLRKCIEEHKWYLSERAHKDVGWEVAQKDFLDVFFQGFTAGFRASYCGMVCKHRDNCVIGVKYTLTISAKPRKCA